MLRIRIGKLAIAVLAVSGAAAHADAEGSFLSKLKKSEGGAELMIAPWVHSKPDSLVPAFRVPFKDATQFEGIIDTPVFANAGPVKLSARVGAGYLGDETLYSQDKADALVKDTKDALEKAATDAKDVFTKATEEVGKATEEDARKTAQTAEDEAKRAHEEAQKKVDEFKPEVRSADNVSGYFFNASVKATIDITDSIYGVGTAGFGVVAPKNAWKEFYIPFVGRLGGGYKVTPNVVVEGAVKTIIPFGQPINATTGVAVGVKYVY